MQVTISKVVASLLGLAYILAAGVSRDGLPFAGTVAVGVLLALALIWFPGEIDSWIRLSRSRGTPGLTMKPSPPWLVALMGWVFLVGLPLFLLLRYGH
jgi:hypothetical protein